MHPPIFIDALNVAYWRGPPPSLRLPTALAEALVKAGREVTLWFDASARHQLAAELGTYAALRSQPGVIEVRSGLRADSEMLRRARASGACIVSRDRFGDHRKRYRKLIDEPGRIVPGFVQGDRLVVPGLDLDVPVVAPCAIPVFHR